MATTIRDVERDDGSERRPITTYTMLDGSKQIATEYVDHAHLASRSTLRAPVGPPRRQERQLTLDTMTTPREDGGSSPRFHGPTERRSRSRRILTEPKPVVAQWRTDGTPFYLTRSSKIRYPLWPAARSQDSKCRQAEEFQGLECVSLYGPRRARSGVGRRWESPPDRSRNLYSGHCRLRTVCCRMVGWCGASQVGSRRVAVGAIPGVGPFAAMGGNIAGGFVFGYVGKLVGNVMCAP